MTHATTTHSPLANIGRFLEHAVVVIGLAMMVVGLGLGVTMVLLPFGLVIGLIGLAVLISGLFAQIDEAK
jgi:hypothetical protein